VTKPLAILKMDVSYNAPNPKFSTLGARGVAQVVDCLPCKCKALSSSLRSRGEKKKEKKKIRYLWPIIKKKKTIVVQNFSTTQV
jgi:hypothetical protein